MIRSFARPTNVLSGFMADCYVSFGKTETLNLKYQWSSTTATMSMTIDYTTYYHYQYDVSLSLPVVNSVS